MVASRLESRRLKMFLFLSPVSMDAENMEKFAAPAVTPDTDMIKAIEQDPEVKKLMAQLEKGE
jgi:hypothetical protein